MGIGTGAALIGSAIIGAGGNLLAANKAKQSQRAPDLIAQENLVTRITPEGTLRVGSIGPEGEFIPSERVAATRTEESPFQEQFRTGREGVSLGLLKQLRGRQLPGITQEVSPTIQPRGAAAIRGLLPSAQASREGLPGIRSAQDISRTLTPVRGAGQIESGLSALVGSEQFGSEISRLEEASFEGVRRRLDPVFRQREQRLTQSLADRGIPLESAAAQAELSGLRESEEEALTRAGFQAVQAGRGEQERLARLGLATRGQQLGEGLSLGGFEAGQRGQRFQEGLGFAGLESGTRAQLFGEKRSQLSDALQKQLALSGLESQQRARQFQEQLGLRQQQAVERGTALSEIGGILGLGTQFRGDTIQTGVGSQAALARQLQAQQSSQNIGDLTSLAGLGLSSFLGGEDGGSFQGFETTPVPVSKPAF